MNQTMPFISSLMDPMPYLIAAYFIVSVLILGFFVFNFLQRKKIQRVLREIKEYKC